MGCVVLIHIFHIIPQVVWQNVTEIPFHVGVLFVPSGFISRYWLVDYTLSLTKCTPGYIFRFTQGEEEMKRLKRWSRKGWDATADSEERGRGAQRGTHYWFPISLSLSGAKRFNRTIDRTIKECTGVKERRSGSPVTLILPIKACLQWQRK